jgi:hypothetical protein
MSDWGPTTQVRAVVTLAGGDTYPGHLHLLDGKHARGLPETPLEMANRAEGFFALTLGDGEAYLVSKDQVAMIMCEWPPENAELVDLEGRRIRLQIRLAGGEEVVGETVAILPRRHSRALDYLNSVTPFFQLNVDGGVRLINRAHVQVVRPLD